MTYDDLTFGRQKIWKEQGNPPFANKNRYVGPSLGMIKQMFPKYVNTCAD